MTQGDPLGYLNALKLTIKHSLAEKFSSGSDRPCDNGDFSESKKTNEERTTEIKQLIENFVKNHASHGDDETTKKIDFHPEIDNELLSLILILCGQNVTLQPWNTEITVRNCEIICDEILKLFNCKDVSELISRDHRVNLSRDILQILCADLTVTEWKHFPASVVCYKWILEMIKQPNLSQYIQFVLPPALLLTDDFVKENRITGVHCLNHIIQNITVAELQLCGHGNVIYNALMPILRVREADLIESTIGPLIYLTVKLEFDLGKKHVTKWSRFDDIFEIYLENMEFEQMLDLRSCYIGNLSLLINAIGHGVIRWSKRVLRIFTEYIETAGKYKDDKTVNNCLKAIENFLHFSSEVTSFHAKQLFYTLLVALHSSGTFDSEIQRENKDLTIKSLKRVLKSLSESEREELRVEIDKTFSSRKDFYMFQEQKLTSNADCGFISDGEYRHKNFTLLPPETNISMKTAIKVDRSQNQTKQVRVKIFKLRRDTDQNFQ